MYCPTCECEKVEELELDLEIPEGAILTEGPHGGYMYDKKETKEDEDLDTWQIEYP